MAGRVLGPGAGYVLKGAQLGTAFEVAIGVRPPSRLHTPLDVGVDEIGQRGWSALHNCPWGIARIEYIEKSRMIAEVCKQTGFRFSPRLQVMLWEGQSGK